MGIQWFSVVFGFLLFPLTYFIMPRLLFKRTKYVKKHCPINYILPISDHLKSEIVKSLQLTENLGWFNVMIQRIYTDSIRNYFLEYKIKENIMKTCASTLGDRLLKKIIIKSINIGREAPYIKNIKVITPEEFNELVKKEENINKEERLQTLNDFINIDKIDSSCFEKKEIVDENKMSNGTDEEKSINHKEIFEYATFHGYFEYNGVIQIMIEVSLPKSIVASLVITIHKINSNFILRIPAINQATRYEMTLINNPQIEIDVDSGFLTSMNRLYFQKSASKIMKNAVLQAFNTSFVFPNWNQFVQPNVASVKLADFYPVYITTANYIKAYDALDDILLICSSDFKLINSTNEILYKKSHMKLNNKSYVYAWSFPIENPHSSTTAVQYFEGLSTTESQVLYMLQTNEEIMRMFPFLQQVSEIFTCNNISILKFFFHLYTQEYIKITYKNHVTFYRNHDKFSEFLVFKIQDNNVFIFNYSNTSSDIFFNDSRIETLYININKKKHDKTTESKEVSNDTVKSATMLKKPCILDNIGGIPLITMESDIDNEGNNVVDFDTLFYNINMKTKFKTFVVNLNMSKNAIRSFIADPEIRVKMFEESGIFVGCIKETAKIQTLVCEYTVKNENQIEEMRVHSLVSKNKIIDTCLAKKQTFIYEIKCISNDNIRNNQVKSNNKEINELAAIDTNDEAFNTDNANLQNKSRDTHGETDHERAKHKYELHVHCQPNEYLCLPNFLIETIKIKEGFEKYFKSIRNMNYIKIPNDFKLEQHVKAGTIYFEFKGSIEDEYNLEIYSCKKQRTIFNVKKINGTNPFRVVIPTGNDYIKISLCSKNNKNIFTEYKLKEFSYHKDILVEGIITVPAKQKFKCKIEGAPSHLIFWNFNARQPFTSYLLDSLSKTEIEKHGVLRADAREYSIVLKSDGEKINNIKIHAGLIDLL